MGSLFVKRPSGLNFLAFFSEDNVLIEEAHPPHSP
jgi:hypothetical protein